MIADGGGFVGKMQHLVVNGNQVFEMLRSGEFHGRSRMRGGGSGTIIGPSSLAPPSALTFRTVDAYLVVNMRIHSTFTIHLQVCFCFDLMVDCVSVGIIDNRLTFQRIINQMLIFINYFLEFNNNSHFLITYSGCGCLKVCNEN